MPDFEVTEEGTIEMLIKYDSKSYSSNETPKTALFQYSMYVNAPAKPSTFKFRWRATEMGRVYTTAVNGMP